MRVILILLAWLTALAFSTTAFAADRKPSSIVVPISYFHDLITVDVYVNDTGPHKFIVDTGASSTVLYQNFSQDMNIVKNGDVTTTVHGVNASESRPMLVATNFRIGDFDLGTLRPVEAPAWRWEGNPVGIIGMDILKSLGVIVDSKNREMTFARPEAFEDLVTPSWRSSKLKMNPYDRKNPRDLPFVFVKLDSGIRVPALFDTGSQITMMNRATANEFFDGYRITNSRKTWVHRDALSVDYVNKLIRVPKLKIGRLKWKKMEVIVKDMTSLDVINKDRRPLMIVGMDLMKRRDFAINFPAQRLYMSGPREVKAESVESYQLAFNEAHAAN